MGKRQRGRRWKRGRVNSGGGLGTAGRFAAAGKRVDDEEKRRHELMRRWMRAGRLGNGSRRA